MPLVMNSLKGRHTQTHHTYWCSRTKQFQETMHTPHLINGSTGQTKIYIDDKTICHYMVTWYVAILILTNYYGIKIYFHCENFVLQKIWSHMVCVCLHEIIYFKIIFLNTLNVQFGAVFQHILHIFINTVWYRLVIKWKLSTHMNYCIRWNIGKEYNFGDWRFYPKITNI